MQERITSEKQRLASVRVRETSDVARAAEALSGQAVSAAATLEELLRRPHVHYRRACCCARHERAFRDQTNPETRRQTRTDGPLLPEC